ncbi:unnamed protein product, partial [Closterium sp. NIES-53]
APGSEEAMELQASMVECYGMLHPSPVVQHMVDRENLTHVQHSTAVYMEVCCHKPTLLTSPHFPTVLPPPHSRPLHTALTLWDHALR